MVELHTGTYANAKKGDLLQKEFERLAFAANFAANEGLMIAAGHGLNYVNSKPICYIQEINELSIGHSIMARAILVGIDRAVRDMLDIINNAVLLRNLEL
jgi:pyridoxine 5-phosphate synthase